MSYIFEHTMLGFCWWDLPAVIILLGVAVYFLVRYRNMKKKQQDIEDRLSDLYAKDAEITLEDL